MHQEAWGGEYPEVYAGGNWHTITTITLNQMYSLFIGLPPLVQVELVLPDFSLDLINRHTGSRSLPHADRRFPI